MFMPLKALGCYVNNAAVLNTCLFIRTNQRTVSFSFIIADSFLYTALLTLKEKSDNVTYFCYYQVP